jgi:WD40 repeat protein
MKFDSIRVKSKRVSIKSASSAEDDEEQLIEFRKRVSLELQNSSGLLIPSLHIPLSGKKDDIIEPPKITKHENTITQLAISPLSTFHVFSSSTDHRIILWDMKMKQPVRVMTGHTSAVTCFSIYVDTSIQTDDYQNVYVISGSKDSEIRVWSVQSGKCVGVLNNVFGKPVLLEDEQSSELHAHHRYLSQSWITSMAINILDKKIYVGGYDGHVASIKFELCNHAIGFEKELYAEKHKRQVTCANFDGKDLFTGSSDGFIFVWDCRGNCKQQINAKSPILAINALFMNNVENSSFVFATLQNDVVFWKREPDDPNDDIEQNDPLTGINDHDTFPINEIYYHVLKLDQITQKKFKPNKYLLSCGYNRRYSTFEFYLLRDSPSYMSAVTKFLIGQTKICGTFVKFLTFARSEGTVLTYYYVKGNEVHVLEYDITSSKEFAFHFAPHHQV